VLQNTALLINRHDYEGMPEGPPYYQVIEGDLLMSPSPNTFHQVIIGRIFAAFFVHLQTRPAGQVFIAPLDVFLDDINIYQPDMIFVSHKSRAKIVEEGIEGPPDLIVEVLSTSTSRLDKGSKKKVYTRSGVEELWLVDPHTKQVEVCTGMQSVVLGVGAVLKPAALPGLTIAIAELFALAHQ
jgi:Uma2 family endonuclease